MERMSPDSTMDPILALTSPDGQISNYSRLSSREQPDSTTNDLSSYDSDAFDSEDSVSSFAEVQEAAESANAALLWPKQIEQPQIENLNESERRERRRISSSSSSSYSEQNIPLTFSNILSTDKSSLQTKSSKKKKTKRAEASVLKCQFCEYTTRWENRHRTNHRYLIKLVPIYEIPFEQIKNYKKIDPFDFM